MKTIQHFIFAYVFILCFAACGSDDDCTPDSVAGTYNFVSVECDPDNARDMLEDGSIENSELFTVSAVDETTISIEAEDGSSFELMLTGCEFAAEPISFDFFGISITSTYSGEFDGDVLRLRISTEIEGEIDGQPELEDTSLSCTIVASR